MRTVLLSACFFVSTVLAGMPAQAAPSAQAIVARGLAAMGGRAKLAALRSIDYVAVGERQMVEQSERPSGPYFLDWYRMHETRDLVGRHTRIEIDRDGYAVNHWWLPQHDPGHAVVVLDANAAAVVTDPAKPVDAGGSAVRQDAELYALAPERLLLTAAAARDLRRLADAVEHGVRMQIVAFSWDGTPVQIALGPDGLPWSVTWTTTYPASFFYDAWGDVTSEMIFTAWALEPNGIRYPREWTTRRVGLPDRQQAIADIHFDVPVDAAAVDVPAAIDAAHRGGPSAIDAWPLGVAGDGDHVLAPHAVQISGAWNVEFVDQPDGVVEIEAPISPAYTKQALAFARARFGKPVKAVITTSDSWPHLAGVREPVAQGIPVYALDLNLPILRRLVGAPHTLRPDDLQRSPRTPRFVPVRGPTWIGNGPTALEILPYRTTTGERQMMVWMPSAKLLYTSDLFAPNGDGTWFTPEYLAEFVATVQRYHLAPRTIVGMHYGATPYAHVLEALATAAPSYHPTAAIHETALRAPFNHAFAPGELHSDIFSLMISLRGPGIPETVRRVAGSATYAITRGGPRVITMQTCWRYDGLARGEGSSTDEIDTGTLTPLHDGKPTPDRDASGLTYNPWLWGTPPAHLAIGTHWTARIPQAWELGPAATQDVRVVDVSDGGHRIVLTRSGEGLGPLASDGRGASILLAGRAVHMRIVPHGPARWRGQTFVHDGIVSADDALAERKVDLIAPDGRRYRADERRIMLLNEVAGATCAIGAPA